MTITNPLFDFESELTLISDNPIFDIQMEDSDESKVETIMDEVHISSPQSTAHVPPPYALHELEGTNSITNSLREEFASEHTHIDPFPPRTENPIDGLFEQNDLHHLLPEIESFFF